MSKRKPKKPYLSPSPTVSEENPVFISGADKWRAVIEADKEKEAARSKSGQSWTKGSNNGTKRGGGGDGGGWGRKAGPSSASAPSEAGSGNWNGSGRTGTSTPQILQRPTETAGDNTVPSGLNPGAAQFSPVAAFNPAAAPFMFGQMPLSIVPDSVPYRPPSLMSSESEKSDEEVEDETMELQYNWNGGSQEATGGQKQRQHQRESDGSKKYRGKKRAQERAVELPHSRFGEKPKEIKLGRGGFDAAAEEFKPAEMPVADEPQEENWQTSLDAYDPRYDPDESYAPGSPATVYEPGEEGLGTLENPSGALDQTPVDRAVSDPVPTEENHAPELEQHGSANGDSRLGNTEARGDSKPPSESTQRAESVVVADAEHATSVEPEAQAQEDQPQSTEPECIAGSDEPALPIEVAEEPKYDAEGNEEEPAYYAEATEEGQKYDAEGNEEEPAHYNPEAIQEGQEEEEKETPYYKENNEPVSYYAEEAEKQGSGYEAEPDVYHESAGYHIEEADVGYSGHFGTQSNNYDFVERTPWNPPKDETKGFHKRNWFAAAEDAAAEPFEYIPPSERRKFKPSEDIVATEVETAPAKYVPPRPQQQSPRLPLFPPPPAKFPEATTRPPFLKKKGKKGKEFNEVHDDPLMARTAGPSKSAIYHPSATSADWRAVDSRDEEEAEVLFSSITLCALRPEELPVEAQQLYIEVYNMSKGRRIIPLAVKEDLESRFERFGKPDLLMGYHHPDGTAMYELNQLRDIVSEGARCQTAGASTADWNSGVHHPLLSVAFRNPPCRTKLGVWNTSAASILSDFLPQDLLTTPSPPPPPSFCIALETKPYMYNFVRSQPPDNPSINQTTYPPLQTRLIAIPIETTSVSLTGTIPPVAVWTWAWMARIRHFAPWAAVPPLPIIRVVGHDWYLSWAYGEWEETELRMKFVGELIIGHTRSVVGTYKILAVLRRLGTWVDDVFEPWAKEMFG